jgi:hypothetical protein
MFLERLHQAVSETAPDKKTAKRLQQAFAEAEKSRADFEMKKQQILQEMKNGTRRSSGRLPV